ncbi:MAG: multiheme c-type cytochrome [Gemmataceae bacterium]
MSPRVVWSVVGLGVAAAIGVAAYAMWFVPPVPPPIAPPAPPPSPRKAEPVVHVPSPYLNVDAKVRYVGDDACSVCHATETAMYRKHPMGRSLRPMAESPKQADLVSRPGNPFDALGVQFRVERRGDRFIHREVARDAQGRAVAETEAAVEYAIGSGTHAISYLIRRDGTLTQSPITWYTQTNTWGLSPSFRDVSDLFERPIEPGCVYCHSNHADAEPGTVNGYRQPIFRGHAIGCERCHGPGALHVQTRQNGATPDVDRTIVNPSRLDPVLREDVCSQCHLGGKERVVRRGREVFDYRPGLPLDEFLRVFVLPSEAAGGQRVAGHTEQMTASRCFQQSAGKLGCISCHDTHSVPDPAEREGFYRDRCLACHETRGCTEPIARRRERTRGDDCTVCHMPQRPTTTGHVALTDHRVPRRPEPGDPKADPPPLASARLLVPFGRAALDPDDAEMARDLAVSLVATARMQPDAFRAQVSRTFLPVLSAAVRAHADDLPAREGLSMALAWQGDLPLALATCDEILSGSPRRELTLCDAGVISRRMGRDDRSLDYWQRALAINPWSSRYRFEVANLLSRRGDWDQAVEECRRILARNGGHANSRLLVMQDYLRRGMNAQARVELEAALALHPPNEADLRRMFAELLR